MIDGGQNRVGDLMSEASIMYEAAQMAHEDTVGVFRTIGFVAANCQSSLVKRKSNFTIVDINLLVKVLFV